MMQFRALCLLCCLFSLSFQTLSAFDSSTLPLGKRAAWVSPFNLDLGHSLAPRDTDNGFYYVLNDQQVNADRQERYHHFAFLVLSSAGLEEASRIEIRYAPAYQSLTVHGVKLYRDGKVLEHHQKVRWQELQQEQSLASGLYDEERTMLMILEDIREGDLVEFDYSIRGSNPIFGGKLYTSFDHGLSVVMPQAYFRLVMPTARNVQVKQHIRELPETRTSLPGGGQEISWAAQELPAIEGEAQTPGWFNDSPWIELSEWRDWQEVKQWGAAVFRQPFSQKVSPKYPLSELEESYAQLSAGLAPEAAALALVRFVQDKVRYFGIEIGANSHQPRHPAEVMGSRFGDCKDKTLLLCDLLGRLGWKAWPVLVNASAGRTLEDQLPSPLAFDHAIALIETPGGKLFVDPTISFQGGDLAANYVPDYGKVLVLDAGAEGLVDMPPREPGSMDLTEIFDSPSFSQTAKLTVTTRYRGSEADYFRYNLATQSRNTLTKTYLDFYKKSFPKTETSKELSVKDDREQNEIWLTEYYQIEELWGAFTKEPGKDPLPMTGTTWELWLYPYAFRTSLELSDDIHTPRRAPLSVPYPQEITHKTIIKLPEAWEAITQVNTSDTPWYRLDQEISYEKQTVTINYRFHRKTDSIPADEIADYRKQTRSDLDNNLNFSLSSEALEAEPDYEARSKWAYAGIGLIILTVSIIAYRRRKNRPPPPPIYPESDR